MVRVLIPDVFGLIRKKELSNNVGIVYSIFGIFHFKRYFAARKIICYCDQHDITKL